MRTTVLIALLLIAPLSGIAQDKPTTGNDWVARSNSDAQVLLKAQAAFAPESASAVGLPGYDDKVAYLGSHNGERFRAA